MSGPERDLSSPAQELNLGSLDENQESKPLVHQGLQARSKVPLALSPIESKNISRRQKLQNRYKVYY